MRVPVKGTRPLPCFELADSTEIALPYEARQERARAFRAAYYLPALAWR